MVTSDEVRDCIVVGAGPGGIMAAVLLARSRRDVVLLDAGHSRARWIPRTRNCPGYPTGITGEFLLHRLRRQLSNHKVKLRNARVTAIAREDDIFVLDTESTRWRARTVVVATGVVDILPGWSGVDEGIRAGVVRLCAVCDGYEVSDQNIAVFGRVEDCIPHACYLRKHSARVTAIHPKSLRCSAEDLALAGEMGVAVIAADEGDCELRARHLLVRAADGGEYRYDTVYIALGCRARTSWLDGFGLELSASGEIPVGARCETTIPGLYAVGDVVSALNQIAVAFGHASLAASGIDQYLPRNPC